MKTSMNQQLVKLSNKSLVLQMIKEQAPLSRAEISQRSGLNKGTVSSLVNELLEEQLCYESGPGESSGGRRPVMLLFNQHAGYSIGIDLGVNYMLAVLTDLQGEVIKEQKMTCATTAYTDVFHKIKEIILAFINEAPSAHYGIVGIGVGVPGIVNKEGSVLLAPNLGWENIPLKRELEQEFNMPVIVENEANAGAYGEKQFGSGQNSDNFIYVSAGIGIGVGIILNGELYRGVNGFSGEMGHMTIQTNGKECRCGNRGCWELYSSEQALLEAAAKAHLTTDKDDLTLERLIQQAKTNNDEALALFEEIGEFLGFGINTIINTFNPNQIVIGNRLAEAQDWLIGPIKNVIKSNKLQFQQKDVAIGFSSLAAYSTALGLSAFTAEQFLKKESGFLS